ncbi:MAG: ABC transporter permease [Candidatus Aenigmarchaeota archaeon]|nr:ABC transporter permease [Candidatus Aenigmarchaeota archaeon]
MAFTNIRLISFLAFKDIIRDKKIALLVIFLLAFSYLNITFFSSFINGLGNTFQEEVIDTGTSHILISVPSDSGKLYLDSITKIQKKIEANPRVLATTSHITVPLKISFGDKSISVNAIAVDPSEEPDVTTIPDKVIDGTFLSSNSDIVLGRLIAGERLEDTIGRQRFGQLITGLDVRVGEVVTVTYPNGVVKQYKVGGIVSSEGFAVVSQGVYFSREEAEQVLSLSDQASNILVRLDDRYAADSVKQFILEQGIASADVKTWSEASSFVGAINATFGVVILATTLVGIVIVLSTIGIVIFINTSRKRRIIGVLKAIGMSSRQIMALFLFQSFIFGVLGTLMGIGMTYGITGYLEANPIRLPVGNLRPVLTGDMVVSTALILLIASLAAGYIPARLAAKHKIIDVIKVVD